MPLILDPLAGLSSVIQSPTSPVVNGDSLRARVPRRALEDYDDVRPWDGDTPCRHVLLRGRYDDEEVVLKVSQVRLVSVHHSADRQIAGDVRGL